MHTAASLYSSCYPLSHPRVFAVAVFAVAVASGGHVASAAAAGRRQVEYLNNPTLALTTPGVNCEPAGWVRSGSGLYTSLCESGVQCRSPDGCIAGGYNYRTYTQTVQLVPNHFTAAQMDDQTASSVQFDLSLWGKNGSENGFATLRLDLKNGTDGIIQTNSSSRGWATTDTSWDELVLSVKWYPPGVRSADFRFYSVAGAPTFNVGSGPRVDDMSLTHSIVGPKPATGSTGTTGTAATSISASPGSTTSSNSGGTSKNSEAADSAASSSTTIGIVVGIVLVGLCCIVLGIAAAILLRQRRRQSLADAASSTDDNATVPFLGQEGGPADGPAAKGMESVQYVRFQPYAPTAKFSSSTGGESACPTYSSLRDLRGGMADLVGIQDPENLIREKEIGRGAYGVVYRGSYSGSAVAIKHLLEGYGEDEMLEFLSEANLMKELKPHRNVVGFVGFATLPATNAPAIVVEFCANGSLEDVLEEEGPLVQDEALRIFLGISRGMAHLAAAHIVHRDLASRNVLLDENREPRVADFGLARLAAPDDQSKTKSNTGPIRWMAPEALGRHYSEKSDVWMFGATLVEGLTATDPFPGLSNVEAAVIVAKGGSPEIPVEAAEIFHRIAALCFVHIPTDRATFSKVVSALEEEYCEI